MPIVSSTLRGAGRWIDRACSAGPTALDRSRYVTDTGVLYGNVFEPPAPFVQNQGQWESPELYRLRVGGKHNASDALQIR
ncbi:MAG TPA: hypothetical protein VFZ65_14470 [Planctomycetota bacterium]|nr:hypothetical protein [Planctomycetota bacterium]